MREPGRCGQPSDFTHDGKTTVSNTLALVQTQLRETFSIRAIHDQRLGDGTQGSLADIHTHAPIPPSLADLRLRLH